MIISYHKLDQINDDAQACFYFALCLTKQAKSIKAGKKTLRPTVQMVVFREG